MSVAHSIVVRLAGVELESCSAVWPPKPEGEVARALDADEIALFLAAAEGSRTYAPIHLALCTGLRKGEVLALRWKDLDGDR